MNSIENEEVVRKLELMVGPDNLRREYVPPCGGPISEKSGEPEMVLETYHRGPDGKMFVSHPSGKMPQPIPPAQSA